jgi:hypothetical protein
MAGHEKGQITVSCKLGSVYEKKHALRSSKNEAGPISLSDCKQFSSKQVEMIGHQHVGDEFNVVCFTANCQSSQKKHTIFVC